MASQNKHEKSKEMDECLTSMCAWIQDSSQIKTNDNDHMLLSMLEKWHPNTLFLDLPTASGSEIDTVTNRAFDNALVEFSDESPEEGQVMIAQYISTNIKHKDHNEVQRVAMHLEKGPRGSGEALKDDVEEITKNQAKVMKKNFTYFKDGKPMHMGKIHVVNIGRERQGNTPMKFSLNYLSTNVPHKEGLELKGADREKALEKYNIEEALRMKREQNKNKKAEYDNSVHLRTKSFENITDLDDNDGHHNATPHDLIENIEVIHDQPKQVYTKSFEDFETPIVRLERTDDKLEKPHPVNNTDNRDNESIDSFDTAVVHHGHSNNTGGRFHLISTENFKFPHVSTFGNPDNNNNGFARAYRYHSKRRSAHLYEWPCPNGSFRMLKTD